MVKKCSRDKKREREKAEKKIAPNGYSCVSITAMFGTCMSCHQPPHTHTHQAIEMLEEKKAHGGNEKSDCKPSKNENT